METVQMRCGNCNRKMAINVADMGGQVHCPHCQAIVDAPRVPKGNADSSQTENLSRDLDPAEELTGTLPFVPLPKKTEPHPDEPTMQAFYPPKAPSWPSLHKGAANDVTEPSLSELQPHRQAKSRALSPILLIFLIPYALVATGVIVYLYLLVNEVNDKFKQFDPMERLPDPKPKEGGPRNQERVQHDAPLPDKLKTRLGQALTIGALKVTPLKVHRIGDDLILNLNMKNVSSGLVFNPLSREFFKAPAGNLPYTFLEGGPKNVRIYGGYPEWRQGAQSKEGLFQGDIKPGEEEQVSITLGGAKFKADVNRLVQGQELLLWRVQVRRGFVNVGGKQVSATAVVGVEFFAKDIEKDG